MNKCLSAILIVSAGLAASACGGRYYPIATHTLAAGENVDQDVVWISEGGQSIMRCQNSKAGPVCSTAQMK